MTIIQKGEPMSVLIKDMEMPKECHGCRWFYFQGTSCTEPKYYLDARCKMVESGQDWYGKDVHGGWIGESIEHIPGWTGYYQYKHCVEMGTMASQCPLCELPSAQPIQTASNYLQSLATSPLLVGKMPSAQPELPDWVQKVEEYRKSAPSIIHNPLAWALYQTWKEYNGQLVHQRGKENR